MASGNAKGESPRTTRVKEIILTAGGHLLCEHGSASVTAVRISDATGVARSTIYRHWPEPASLLKAVVDRIVRPPSAIETTGDLARDLRMTLSALRHRMQVKPYRVVFSALLEQANADETFAEAQRQLVDGVLQPTASVLREAQEEGRLPETMDIDLAVLALAGPLMTQHVMLRAPIEDALIDRVVLQFVGSIPS